MRGNENGRPARGGQARVALAYARDLAKRSTGCWIAYFVAWLLVTVFPLVFVASLGTSGVSAVPWLWQLEWAIALVGTAIGSIAAAVRVFRCAFERSEADFAGALPCRRPVLFAAVALAGFVPLVAVLLAVAVVLALLALAMPFLGLSACGWWLALAVTFTFVFYAVALLCVQFVGRASAAVVLYVGANFFLVVAELVVRFIVGYFTWGLDLGAGGALLWTSPFIGMWRYGFVMNGDGGAAILLGASSVSVDEVRNLSDLLPLLNWGHLGLYAAAGLACLLLALLLNSIRPLERAGEWCAYEWVRVVLAVAGGVVGALVLGVCAVLVAGNVAGSPLPTGASVTVAVLMGAGGLLGSACADVCLRGKSTSRGAARQGLWKLAGIVGAAVLVAGLCGAFDAFGVESRVPDAAQVESVAVTTPSAKASFSSEEQVKRVCAAQGEILGLEDDARAELRDAGGDCTTVAFGYRLADGSMLARSYEIPRRGAAGQRVLGGLSAVFNSREGVDSRLSALASQRPNGLEITYARSDGDAECDIPENKATAFIWGPLSQDAHAHGVLDVDLSKSRADEGGANGKLGQVIVSSMSDGVPAAFVPVSREGSPAIAKWLSDEMHVRLS